MNITAQKIATDAIAKAVSHLGDQEDASHNNTGPQVDRFLAYVGIAPGFSWCSAFVSFCFGNAATEAGSTISACNLIKTASCAAQANHARANGHLVSGLDAVGRLKAGWVMLKWENGDYHHTGIVTGYDAHAGTFSTIEGNSNQTGSSEGYEVCRQTRRIADVSGGHPVYAFVATW